MRRRLGRRVWACFEPAAPSLSRRRELMKQIFETILKLAAIRLVKKTSVSARGQRVAYSPRTTLPREGPSKDLLGGAVLGDSIFRKSDRNDLEREVAVRSDRPGRA
jgi:hypothetical protein